MQLTYCGVAHQASTISLALPVSQQTGKYRGQTIDFSSAVRMVQSPVSLKYRNVAYPRSEQKYRLVETFAV